jgi:copper(I)-binding protein
VICVVVLGPTTVMSCDGVSNPGPDLEILGARVRPAVVSGVSEVPVNSAAYMEIRNRGAGADRLLGARYDGAKRVEIHQTRVNDEGLAMMQRAGSVPIPAMSAIRLEPGGLHVMLFGLQGSLFTGDSVRLTLEFEISGVRDVAAEVRP